MAIHIFTDSTCDISKTECQALGVHVVPLQVIFEDGVYADGVDLDHETFYQKQSQATTLPTTAQANPADFAALFEPLLQQNDQIVGVFVSSRLSGTLQSAQIGASMCAHPQDVFCIDSLSTTVGLGLLVRIAASLRDQGFDGPTIQLHLNELRHRVEFCAFVSTLKYLAMGGRISSSSALLGTLLHITPAVRIVEGAAIPTARLRGRAKILQYARQMFQDAPMDSNYPLCFAHSACADVATAFQQDLCTTLDAPVVTMDNLGAVLGTHAGPGCYGFAYIRQD